MLRTNSVRGVQVFRKLFRCLESQYYMHRTIAGITNKMTPNCIISLKYINKGSEGLEQYRKKHDLGIRNSPEPLFKLIILN